MSLFRASDDQLQRNARALSTDHLMSDLGRRTASGGLIAVGSQAIKMGLQLVQAAILARLLAPEDFGLMAMAMTVTGFITIFTDLGLSTATIQSKEIDQDTVSALFFMNIAMGLVVMLLCFAAAPVAAWFFNEPRVTWVVIGLSAMIPIGSASAQHGALLARGMRWFTLQWTGLVLQVLGMVVAVTLAWRTDLGYWSLVFASWATAPVGLVLTWVVSGWQPTRVRNWEGARSALNFGVYLAGFNVVNYVHRQVDNVLVGWRWGPTELGFYSRAYTLFNMPLTAVVWPMSGSVTSAMCRVQHDPERLRQIYGSALSIGMWAGCGAATVSFVYAEPIVLLIYGNAWGHVVSIFQALALSILIQPLYSSIGWVAIAMGYTKRKFYTGILAACIYAVAFRIGVEYGAIGVAYAYGIAIIFIVPVWTYILTKGSPISMGLIARISMGPVLTGVGTIAVLHWLFGGVSTPTEATLALPVILVLAIAGYAATTFGTPWCVIPKARLFFKL